MLIPDLGTTSIAAYKKIADTEAKFFSRGDNSGTHKKELPNLLILFRGDSFLFNTYNALCQADDATPGQKYASNFIDFISSDKGQDIIRQYGADIYGEGLYNDAEYAKQYDH